MRLEGKKAAVLVGPGYEDLEFWVPFMRLQEEGADVTIAGPSAGADIPNFCRELIAALAE